MRVIAFYLPQYHAIPENDAWWGEGFTEWRNVRRAKPLFPGHEQPREPLEYYDLSDAAVQRGQIALAKQYGVYGFCYYHYWFGGKLMLQKPLERLLVDDTLDLPFCVCWANEHWTRAWEGRSDKILMPQTYGGRAEWEAHFRYLLPFLKDARYIREQGKPLVVIYRPDLMDCCNDMLDCWQALALQSGLPGLTLAYQQVHLDVARGDDSRFDLNIEYQPQYARYDLSKDTHVFLRHVKRALIKPLARIGVNIEQARPGGLIREEYDAVWNAVLARTPINEKCVPGAFVGWDNTPRKLDRGIVIEHGTPEKFERYMRAQIARAKTVYRKDLLFLFAWNEWAEGGYLEPDKAHGAAYLDALRRALEANGETLS